MDDGNYNSLYALQALTYAIAEKTFQVTSKESIVDIACQYGARQGVERSQIVRLWELLKPEFADGES